ncbi:MAG: hypothetical protein DCC67_18855 [Planctomycetota bacterium]|nr:MAG: hypothetical protein DCC67_18855 [Planctomycetota bacterium]
MAAKENQGLQAIVIVLTILLLLTGVGLLLVNNARKTAVARAASAEKASSDAQGVAAKAQNEANMYKLWIGFPEEAALETLEPQYKADQERFGKNMEEQSRKYRTMLDNIDAERQTLVKNEADAKAQVKQLSEQLAAVEAEKERQIKEHLDALNKAKAEFAAEQAKFAEDRAATLAEKEKIAASMQKLQEDHAKEVADLNAQKTALQNTIAQLERRVSILREGVPNPDQFAQPADGVIRWVDQRDGTVWINLGSADGLRPQVTFSVIDSDSADAEAAKQKGTIEVVRVEDAHMAEAKITSDDPKNPLMAGDRIYSQVWDRGRQVNFGVAGFIDLDKDGRSDLQKLKDIIAASNGKVVAAPDETGKLPEGAELQVDTRFLILGKFPEGARPQDIALRESWQALSEQAQSLGIETIPLDEFIKLMGWQLENRSVAMGAGSRSEDFPPEPQDATALPRRTEPTGVFKKRLPGVSY